MISLEMLLDISSQDIFINVFREEYVQWLTVIHRVIDHKLRQLEDWLPVEV